MAMETGGGVENFDLALRTVRGKASRRRYLKLRFASPATPGGIGTGDDGGEAQVQVLTLAGRQRERSGGKARDTRMCRAARERGGPLTCAGRDGPCAGGSAARAPRR